MSSLIWKIQRVAFQKDTWEARGELLLIPYWCLEQSWKNIGKNSFSKWTCWSKTCKKYPILSFWRKLKLGWFRSGLHETILAKNRQTKDKKTFTKKLSADTLIDIIRPQNVMKRCDFTWPKQSKVNVDFGNVDKLDYWMKEKTENTFIQTKHYTERTVYWSHRGWFSFRRSRVN